MYIYDLRDAAASGAQIGGKADSLSKMLGMHLPVPEGYVICAEAFNGTVLRKDAAAELDVLIHKLSASGHTYAVRSSAVGEDGSEDSFAGAYETVLDVAPKGIAAAVQTVAESVDNERVKVYAGEKDTVSGKAAVVIQRMIMPDYAGVIFTADPISGNRGVMTGSYVRGMGEKLVSGDGADGEFTIDAVRWSYKGGSEMEPYAKKLYHYAKKIASDGTPKDIEWAVKDGKICILQSRPITTLHENDVDSFDINDSLCGELLLSKTNVGEIFLRPVSPMTYSMVSMIGEVIGIPLISNVCGQLYLNITGVCSMIMAFGVSKEKAFGLIKEIAGGIAEVPIPVYPYDKKILWNAIKNMLKKPKGKKSEKYKSSRLKGHFTEVSLEVIDIIRKADSRSRLAAVWKEECEPFMAGALTAIMTGLDVKSLFGTRKELEKICGTEMADRLMSDCSGNGSIESLGPLLALADVAEGRMTREDYTIRYGHRHADEMELSMPYPYEDSSFPDNVIADYIASGTDAYAMRAAQERRQEEAVRMFTERYPYRQAWLDKKLKKYSAAVAGREIIRSDALRLFCVIREYLLMAGKLTGLGDDIFMLQIREVEPLLRGDTSCVEKIPARRHIFEAQMEMPNFPSMICGRFTLEEWQASGSPGGYYRLGETTEEADAYVINGVAGSAGQRVGRARVLKNIDEADTIEQGDILVVPAANIGWVKVFPKISALVTDVGASLSHAVIVARELGIPATVSCQNASSRLCTGDRIRVDGTLGKVYILPDNDITEDMPEQIPNGA